MKRVDGGEGETKRIIAIELGLTARTGVTRTDLTASRGVRAAAAKEQSKLFI